MSLPLLLSLLGLACFQRGFFSSRSSVDTVSTTTSTSTPSNHSRVLLFVIDALRADFVTPATFPFMHELLAHNATQSVLLTLRADPPTTTSQRLKALTTGTLPVFLDVSGNFASDAVREDSWVVQLASKGGRPSVMVGDDTWMRLFPRLFSPWSVPLDSFNTRDLDSVDDGVEARLLPFMGRPEGWGLLVAHFLGVDHIGHTHSAHHPLMAERLRRMDELLERVVRALPDDALLLLLGDHGMTDDGNHGGATRDETDAAFFAYSKNAGSFSNPNVERWDADEQRFVLPHSSTTQSTPLPSPRQVAQVDLVPTISLLLGLPVPFSNLGAPIPELLRAMSPGALLVALRANSRQVLEYLRGAGGLSGVQLRATEAVLAEAEALHDAVEERGEQKDALYKAQAAYFRFLASCLSQARSQWASFSLPWMVGGMVLLVFGVVVSCPPPALRLVPLPSAALLLGSSHAVSAFSNSCILEEHWLCLGTVSTLTLLVVMQQSEPFTTPALLLLLVPRLYLAPASAPALPPTVARLGDCVCFGCVALLLWRGRTRLWAALRHRNTTCALEWPALGLAVCLLSRTPGAPSPVVLQRMTMACAALDAVGCLLTARKRSVSLLHASIRQLAVLLLLVTPGRGTVFVAMAALGASLWLWLEQAHHPPAPWVLALMLSLMGRVAFFASGHRFDFGALQLAAGFTGNDTFSFYPAGFLLALNTMGWDILSLLLAVGWTRAHRSALQAVTALRPLLAYRLLLLLGACGCCALHRRHLMVWSIFAPKLVFEAAFFLPWSALYLILHCK